MCFFLDLRQVPALHLQPLHPWSHQRYYCQTSAAAMSKCWFLLLYCCCCCQETEPRRWLELELVLDPQHLRREAGALDQKLLYGWINITYTISISRGWRRASAGDGGEQQQGMEALAAGDSGLAVAEEGGGRGEGGGGGRRRGWRAEGEVEAGVEGGRGAGLEVGDDSAIWWNSNQG